MQAVFGLRGKTDHPPTVGYQRAEFTNFHRWHPDSRQQSSCVQLCQRFSSFAVGLDLGPGDQGHMGRVDEGNGMDMWRERVIQFVCVGAHLNDYSIIWGQVFHHPVF